jgi:ABC-type polysaccharide/polyol phosphate export permease
MPGRPYTAVEVAGHAGAEGLPAGFGPTETAALRRRLHVLFALARSDLRIRYGRGSWQVVNWMVNPFALVGIYLLLRIMLDRGDNATALSIACAVVPFQVLMQTVESSMSAVSLREPVLLNRRFDRMLLAPSSLVTESLAFGASCLLFPITMIIGGIAPTAALLWLPVVLASTAVFALGLTWPAALAGLWFPNLKVAFSQGFRILFFAAAGIVALDEVSDELRPWLMLNPLTGVFEGFRSIFVYGKAPAAWEILGPTFVGLALTIAFVPVFRREQRHFAKLIGS